ncbi:multiheme c-type cytochrome [Flavicella sediminum]|uniref:multiheme c-type cytochrome n=1 Tax=Flavicella sediminum TaxID=2585141 RepID=UPI00111DEC47|nr:cytochrome c3 family protein [Flavicella sediminum]
MNFEINPLRFRQFIGICIGLILGLLLVVVFGQKSNEKYVSIGPMNVGHEEFSCNTCHADATGNLWQQLQSNLQYSIGLRENSVEFGTIDVKTKKCLVCHDRDNDRHPTHRFLEPKFRDAVKKINTANCNTCHSEHNAKRLTLKKVDYCMHCHEDLSVKNDPLDISHTDLIKNKEWSTCLQCHDFHGNHEYKVPTKLKDTITYKTLRAYFDGGKDPFSPKKKFIALSEKEWIKKYIDNK